MRSLLAAGAICCGLLAANSSNARPRSASPPMPERQLATFRFDDRNWIAKPVSNVVAGQNLRLVESWSEYALDMSGDDSLLVLPVSAGVTRYLAPNSGTVRFWFAPSWTSAMAGGLGPKEWARLVEIGKPGDEQFWITLAVDPTGNVLTLAARSGQRPAVYLQTPIQWQAGAWHQVAIVYSPTNTMLVLDGAAVAATENGIFWPASGQWPQLAFAIGSGLDGADLAKGQFEELTTFGFPVNLEYLAWNYRQFAPLAAWGPMTEEEWAAPRSGQRMLLDGSSTEMMTTSSEEPPVPGPPGGGGGTNIPPIIVPSGPGLKLTQPLISGGSLATSLREADTSSAYDIFQKLGLHATNTWSRVAMGEIGQTNFTLAVPSTNHAFFIAAAVVDSDFDGLPDAYEELILGTSPLVADSNGNGIPDGNEDRNGNGLPDYVDYNGLTRAIVFATRTNAFEGGQPGEVTVRLPSSAPTNNTLVKLHLGGLADYDGDYHLAKLNGTRVTNDLFFVIGEREIRLQVHVTNDLVQSSIARKVSVALESSANFQLDPNRADVNLIDNDLPTVSVVASDAKAGEPKGTNLNPGAFVIRRDGMLTNALSINFTLGGSATAGSDYTNFTSPIVIPAGGNVVTIPVNPIHDTNYEGNENVLVTLQSSASYQIDPQAPTGMVTVADNDLPLVYFVGTDLVATEYNGPKPASVTLRRTGNTSLPLTVSLAIGGTATNAVDYQFLTNMFTFAAGASEVNFNVQPLADSLFETAESVVLVLKGGRAYDIGSSNMVTVFIDDSNPTQYFVVQGKQASCYDPIAGVTNPAVLDVRRFGRASQAANVGFIAYTNSSVLTTKYRVYGDVSATNAVFGAFATNARLNFTAQGVVTTNVNNGGVEIQFPSFDPHLYAVFFEPAWQSLEFKIVETNIVEGGAVQGRVRVSRKVAGPAMQPAFILERAGNGVATPAGFPLADHTLSEEHYFTLPSGQLSVDITFTANTDGSTEGWEGVIFRSPEVETIEYGWPYADRHMGFIRENVANPDALPQGDYDRDGLGDRWEVTHGFDPFTPGEAVLDPDKDGLTNEDEYRSSTDPNDSDTDNDGENDFVDLNRPGNDEDFLEIRLMTRTTGKINNGQNCAVCHVSQLKVGEFSHFSRPRTNLSEKSFFFRKGTNYPMFLTELAQNAPPATGNSGAPSTTATYTAAVLPSTNQPRAFVVQDPQARLGTNKPWSSFPTDPSTSFGTLIVPKIEVSWEASVGNTPLDTNSNVGGGLRIFPDALNPDATGFRNTVIVNVKTIPALPGQQVRLKSFDVDDATPAVLNKGGIVDTNDFFGFADGNDNAGTPAAGQFSQNLLTLDSQGRAFTVFTVTTKPGDNFRVAAVLETPGAEAHLDSLQVTNEFEQFYITADSQAVFGFAGGLSPMLTVWRKLHLEFDSMDLPPSAGPEALFVNASVINVVSNSPAQGVSRVRLRHTARPGPDNAFERGKVEISGVGTFAITKSHTARVSGESQYITSLEVLGVPGSVPIGTSAKLYDDDERYLQNDVLYPSLANMNSPPLPAHTNSARFIETQQWKFDAAYIKLVDSATWNGTIIIPFKRSAPSSVEFFGLFSSDFDVGNLDFKGKDRPEFWAFSVVFGYEPQGSEDGEPDGEEPTGGESPEESIGSESRGFAVVWMESIREREFSIVPPQSFANAGGAAVNRVSYFDDLYAVIAHEIGHAPGSQSGRADHREGGVMKAGARDIKPIEFSPVTIKRFRSATSWTQ